RYRADCRFPHPALLSGAGTSLMKTAGIARCRRLFFGKVRFRRVTFLSEIFTAATFAESPNSLGRLTIGSPKTPAPPLSQPHPACIMHSQTGWKACIFLHFPPH
ncbi:MAG: hypothetical protein QM686_19205, partial [Herbaspirillum sp.]